MKLTDESRTEEMEALAANLSIFWVDTLKI